jgi:hypothetical protein
VARERIRECGVAHFDAHRAVVAPDRQAASVQRLGLDPERPYLFFGMSSPVFAPAEIEIVEWLAQEVRSGAFGERMQLIVRPHPQNVQGAMADLSWLPRLEALKGPRVAVDIPSLAGGQLPWTMEEADLPRLANLLAGCSTCLNSGSTLSIDAILHDKPVVMTAFDADQELPWWRSARRLPEYPHLAKVLRLGGIRVARSFPELRTAIQEYLADPARDRAGRAAVRSEECGACDGRSSSRIADALAALAACGGSSRPAACGSQPDGSGSRWVASASARRGATAPATDSRARGVSCAPRAGAKRP